MSAAVVTFTSIGYGDIIGTTTGERGFIVVFALLSAAIMAYMTGNIVSWTQAAEARRTKLSDKLSEVKAYIRYRGIQPVLGGKLLHYYRFKGFTETFVGDDAELLGELPPALRNKVAEYFRGTLLRHWCGRCSCVTCLSSWVHTQGSGANLQQHFLDGAGDEAEARDQVPGRVHHAAGRRRQEGARVRGAVRGFSLTPVHAPSSTFSPAAWRRC